MTVPRPTQVDNAAETGDFGDSQLAIRTNTNVLIAIVDGIGLFVCLVAFLVAINSSGALSVVVAVFAALLFLVLGWHLVSTLLSRRIYLYQRGVVTTGWRGQVKHAHPWRDLDLHWARSHSPRAGPQTPLRDDFRARVGGRVVFRHAEPEIVGDGKLMAELAADARTPVLRERFANGETLTFGAFTISQSMLLYRGLEYDWDEIDDVNARPERFGIVRIRLRLGKPIVVNNGKVPNFLAFAAIVNEQAAKHKPE